MSRNVFAYINLGNLRHNYRLLKNRTYGAELMAVVKANAYGHGIDLVAPALYAEGCRTFAVTDAEEAAKLRHIVGDHASIVPLSGIFDHEDAHLCSGLDLTPVVTETFHLDWLHQAGFSGRIWLKIDTGMQRFGTTDLETLIAHASQLGIHICGVMTHLACADEPEHPLNALQFEHFRKALQLMPKGTLASILNSAGIAAFAQQVLDIARPGIALYGAEPIPQLPLGLKPVMSFVGNVIQIREVKKGSTISYGATYTAPADMRVALVSLGYADGLPRLLSNLGSASSKSKMLPILGRICMDYCLLDASHAKELTYNDQVQFWGDEILANEAASLIGTIAYELFTGVNARVSRIGVDTP